MPLITIDQTVGKTADENAQIIAAVTTSYAQACGVKPESVWVIIRENSRNNWGVAGSTLTARAKG